MALLENCNYGDEFMSVSFKQQHEGIGFTDYNAYVMVIPWKHVCEMGLCWVENRFVPGGK